MRENAIWARHKRRDKATTDSKHTLPMAEILLDRNFAPAESFLNSLKNERVHGTRHTTREQAISDLFDYIEVFYNRSRRHSMLGYHSPIQFLQDWITTQHERKIAT